MQQHSPSSLPDGTIVFQVSSLLTQAQESWNTRVTQRMLAQVVHLPYKNILSLCLPSKKQTYRVLDLAALGKLCWYFSCPIDSLLIYLVSHESIAPLPHVHIGRIHPPLPSESPPHTQFVDIQLPETLRNAKIAEVLEVTHLKRDTIIAIRTGRVKRIKRATLTAICNAEYQRTGKQVSISEMLTLRLK